VAESQPFLPNSSGSFATFAAIRRASSLHFHPKKVLKASKRRRMLASSDPAGGPL
jgi:hypothetical protein